MTDHTDEPHDWPLRDSSSRLRPPARRAAEEEESASSAEPESDPVPEDAAPPEAEILYEEPSETSEEPSEALDEPSEALDEPEEPAEAFVGPSESSEAPVAVEEHSGGEFRVPDGYPVLEGARVGQRRSVAIVVSRFNGEITNRLLDAALGELEEAGVAPDAVLVMPVPGAFELPIAAMALAKTRRYACVIALGCVIRGETPHFEYVASEAASGLQLAGIETGVPVSFGVLTCDTIEQAEARADRGAIAARTALEMADAFAQLRTAAAR